MKLQLKSILFILIVITIAFVRNLSAQTNDRPFVDHRHDKTNINQNETSAIEVVAPRPALEDSVDTYASPITRLRYEPLVDVQSRNIAEAQGDISIRGGIFENSGFQLGAGTLTDPQTGHYIAEVPVTNDMLSPVRVLTGFENSLFGYNATAGTIKYDWKKIKDSGVVRAGVGTYNMNRQDIYAGFADLTKGDIGSIGFDLSLARSETDGAIIDGDQDLNRVNARFQLSSGQSQTDLFWGRQNKDFTWPYLYAVKALHDLVGSSGIETEDLRTDLLYLNHKTNYGDDSFFELSAFHRKNRDDYEFDKKQPGLFNPFQHETRLTSVAANGKHVEDIFDVSYNAQFQSDDIDSTSLLAGKFDSRNSVKFAAAPGITTKVADDRTLRVQVGAGYDDNNRDDAHVSPLARIGVTSKSSCGGEYEVYTEYSQSSQVPGYTALGSSSTAGLFRGNADLAREITGNVEGGLNFNKESFVFHTAVFNRNTNNLTDWVYDSSILPYASRAARNVDIDTLGAEVSASNKFDFATLVGSYTYLNKDSDYGDETVNASFYALNFPTHRATFSAIVPLTDQFSIRNDLEFRRQLANSLRSSSDTTYMIDSASITWKPGCPCLKGLELSLIADNIGRENFEEIPGVPAIGRTAALVASYRW